MLALYKIILEEKYEVESLFTTVVNDDGRTTSHKVREELLDEQAMKLGYPLRKIRIPSNASNENYNECLSKAFAEMREAGATHLMFGDIHLEDIRDYRIKMLEGTGLTPVFPLWGRDSASIVKEIIDLGFKAVITCVDTGKLPGIWAGEDLNSRFVEEAPSEIDICGEYGEYHTFVYDGPIFKEKVSFKLSDNLLVEKNTYTGSDLYCADLIPFKD